MRVVRVDFEQDPQTGLPRAPEPAEHPAPELEVDLPLVLVIWRDAFFDFDQHGAEDVRPDYLVNTVGFLLADGPKFVSLAQEVLPDGDGFRAVTHIPTSIVERIVQLAPDDGASDDDEF